MAGLTVAWASKAAIAPAGGLVQRRSAVRSSSGSGVEPRGVGAKRYGGRLAAAGLGSSSLMRLPAERVATPELKRSLTIVAAKAEGQVDVTELQEAAEDLLKKVKATWANVDDKLAVGGLGFVALIVLWGSTGLLYAIDKLPVIPQFLELVGLLFTGWFVYRYVLFKPDREELLKIVDDTKSKITGQDNI